MTTEEITIEEVKRLSSQDRRGDTIMMFAIESEYPLYAAAPRIAALAIRQAEEIECIHKENSRFVLENQALRSALDQLRAENERLRESYIKARSALNVAFPHVEAHLINELHSHDAVRMAVKMIKEAICQEKALAPTENDKTDE